jgi:hypothetical protein
MNNVIKTGSLTSLVFTVIAIGLFGGGISTALNVGDVFAEKYKDGKNSNNIDANTVTTISLKNSSEKCSPLDPRGC